MNLLIEIERLIIRPPKPGDAKPLNMAINRSLKEIGRWMPWASDLSLETTANFIMQGIRYWEDPKPKALPGFINNHSQFAFAI